MVASPARTRPFATLLPCALLALMLFLLSADLLHVPVSGRKIKFAYFFVIAAWLFAPRSMFEVVRAAVARLPWYVWLPLPPLAVSVATSFAVNDSVAWTLWLAFDLFTVATVYAFLRVHELTGDQIRASIATSLGIITLFCVVQFVRIYVFGEVVFQPQQHMDVYRINGLAGWPHFLNIFSFLLLPIVLVQRRPSWATRALLVVLMFMLVQSTAKTGWVLFVALGVLLVLLDRRVFLRSYLAFLLPVTVVLLFVPTPSFKHEAPAQSGGEKIGKFSHDFNITEPTTSGTDRVLITAQGLRVWAKYPWFGVGPRAYDDYVYTRFDQEFPGVSKLGADKQIIAKNENVWVELLAENGILFTLAFAYVVVRALAVARWRFGNRLHLGAWIALVLYFGVSGQFSQTILLTMVYAVFGIYFYARELTVTARTHVEPPATILPTFPVPR
jgi:O-antigen ligase